MAILLTGGTGKTSQEIAALLQNAKVPFVSASRKGAGKGSSQGSWVKFDFIDANTFENPFKHEFPGGQSISAIYLITPEAPDPVPLMNSFIDFAIQKGVQRFVLLTGSTAEPNSPSVGQVWNHLIELRVEYCILRASWFMEVTDYRVLGPELLTHDQISEKLSNGLGRKIEHVKISPKEVKQRYMGLGLPEQVAAFMAWLNWPHTAQGGEERENDVVERLTGRKAERFDDWVARNKDALT
ncbi:MAG: hypothetical protein Q9160_005048 [Pyrenula sp. 1 TL-2023]